MALALATEELDDSSWAYVVQAMVLASAAVLEYCEACKVLRRLDFLDYEKRIGH